MERSTSVERSRQAVAQRFNALADPARVTIVGALRAGPRCVCELREDLGMASNLLSYHLRILRQAGLATGTRNGRRVEYRLETEGLSLLERDLAALAGGR